MIMPTAVLSQNWDEVLKEIPEAKRDIYFTEKYHQLYEDGQDKAECFIYREGAKVFLFPYLKRRIEILDGEYYDFESVYGYSGPLTNDVSDDFLRAATKNFQAACRTNKIVCGFTRFHPLLENHRWLKSDDSSLKVIHDRKTVFIPLTGSTERIWKNINEHHQRAIKKCEKAELRFEVDENLIHLDEFIKLYDDTMKRVGAKEFYFFEKDYHLKIKETLGKNVVLGLVFLQKRVVAAAMFFVYGTFGNYHLGGSAADAQKHSPNNFLFHQMALYMKEKGIKALHLGGGTDNAPDNSLYLFKRRFSNEQCDFYLGKFLFDKEVYGVACENWERRFPEKKEKCGSLFLKYRN